MAGDRRCSTDHVEDVELDAVGVRRVLDQGQPGLSTLAEQLVAAARAHGWPVTVLAGRHLHQLVAPAEVASAVTDLTASVLRA